MSLGYYTQENQDETLAAATKRGAAWIEEEDDLLRSINPSHQEMLAAALLLERTLAATILRYYLVRRNDAAEIPIEYASKAAFRDDADESKASKARRRLAQKPCACAMAPDHSSWCPEYLQLSA